MPPCGSEPNPIRSLFLRLTGILHKYTDFPLLLYMGGLLLMFGGFLAQSRIEIENRSEYCTDGPVSARENMYYPLKNWAYPVHWCWPSNVLQNWLQERADLQTNFRNRKYDEISDEQARSRIRIENFKASLTDANSPSFLLARQKYEEEKYVQRALEDKLKKLKRSSDRLLDIFKTTGVYVLTLCTFLFASFYLYRLSRSHISDQMELTDWKAPYWSFVGSSYLSLTAMVFYTSIYKAEKSWFGESSFHVSWESWCYERLAIFGMCMITAIPMTQLWCYLRKEFIPKISMEWLVRPNKNSSVANYIQFMQIWTIVIFSIFSIISIAATRWAASYQDNFENAYLIVGVYGVTAASLLIGKMIRNAMVLRRRYHETISENFVSWKELKDSSVADDPTLDFIGATWWKLPANFIGIATVMWAALKFTGVSNIIVDALK